MPKGIYCAFGTRRFDERPGRAVSQDFYISSYEKAP